MRQSIIHYLRYFSFWTVAWMVSFKLSYLVFWSPDIDFFIVSLLFFASIIGILLHELIFRRSENRFIRSRSLWKTALFWTVFWNLLVPEIMMLWWWMSSRDCTCGEAWICFCPPDNLLLTLTLGLGLLYLTIPGFLLIAPLVGLMWELVWRRFNS